MSSYGTNNPPGSSSLLDLWDNTVAFDNALNEDADTWVNRLGEERPTVPALTKQAAVSADKAAASEAAASTTLASALKNSITFEDGGRLNSQLDRISDGTFLYYWTGVYPVTVPAGSTVDSTGGINIGAWACDTDLPFRTNLGSGEEGMGAALVANKQPFGGSGSRNQHKYNAERFSFFDMPGAGFDLFNPFTDYDDIGRAAAVGNRSVYYGIDQLVAPRMGLKSWKYIDGTHDRSCIVSIRNTMTPDDMSEPSTQSFGAASLATLSRYSNRDGVGIYCHIVAPPELLKSVNTNFTATTVTCPDLTPELIAQLRYRMIIDITDPDGKWWTSFLTGVDAATKTLTILTGWTLQGSAGATTGTPAAGAIMRIVGLTKVWAQNSLLSVNEDSRATAMAGYELGMYNNKSAISGVGYGYDMYSGGSYNIENGFQARGLYYTGFNSKSADATRAFASTGSVPHGFYSNGDTRGLSVHNNLYGIVVNDPTSYAMQVQRSGIFTTGMDLNGKWQRFKGLLTSTARGGTISYYATSTVITGGSSNTDTVAMPSPEHSLMLFVRNLSTTYAVILTGVFEGTSVTTYTLAAGKGMLFQSDGTYWYPML